MPKIKNVWAREILDSRGTPTVEAALEADNGEITVSSVPSGASTGSHEALELRDKDDKRFHGKGVLRAVNTINKIIAPEVQGMEITDQFKLDKKLIDLDGTENKSRLGANTILAVSESTCKAGAVVTNVSLFDYVATLAEKKKIKIEKHIPIPLFNMINGGLHGAGNLDFQEFHVIPASHKKYKEGLRAADEIYITIGENLSRRGAIHSVGDEGGYAPNLFTNADAFAVLSDSVREAQYSLGRDVFFGLDVAASVFFKKGNYEIRDKSTPLNPEAMLDYYKQLNDTYHLAIIEDPFHEDEWESWKKITAELGGQVIIVGDDLLVSNPKRVKKAIAEKACNGVLVKPNQIGTISETLDVIKITRDAGWKVVVSHRSGETNDWFIADFAVGVGADYVKFGAPARGERVAKYNRLLSIEAELEIEQMQNGGGQTTTTQEPSLQNSETV